MEYLDVWLRIPPGEDEAEAEANTRLIDGNRVAVDWHLTAVGSVKTVTFATITEAHDWLESEGFEDYSSEPVTAEALAPTFSDLLEVALWTGMIELPDGNGDGGLDQYADVWDIDGADQEALMGDWVSFVQSEWSDILEFTRATGLPLGSVAHDFHLTRNGHGAGFWDRGAGDVGERLTEAARAYGAAELHAELTWHPEHPDDLDRAMVGPVMLLN